MKSTKIKKEVICKVKPLFTRMVCTADKFTEDEARSEYGVIDASKVGMVKDIQRIIAVNERTETMGIKEGDYVLLDFKRYAVYKDKKDTIKSSFDEYRNTVVRYDFPTLVLDEEEYLLLDTADIIVIILEKKEVEVAVKSGIIPSVGSNLIL